MLRRSFFNFLPVGLVSLFIKNEVKAEPAIQIVKFGRNVTYHCRNGVVFFREDHNSKGWFNENGKYHKIDGPALIYDYGYQEWYRDGKLHRDDGPAIERADGYKAWYINGTRRPETDGIAVENADGTQYLYVNGVLKIKV